MVNYSQHQTTGNKAIDMCANLIGCARASQKAVKALHLKTIMYEWFKSGVQTLMNKPLEQDQEMQFDGVDIEKASKFQTRDVVIEYYEPIKAEA